MNCGDIEENSRVLDQCNTNNNFIRNAVLRITNSNVLLETRLREFNRIAVDVGGAGGVGDLDFECVTKMDDISILFIRSDNQ